MQFPDKFLSPKQVKAALIACSVHIQVRSYVENFRSECNDVISWISRPNYFPGFTEGWATYAEYPLMTNDTDIYNNTTDKDVVLQKYGMLKYQVMTKTIVVRVSVTLWCCYLQPQWEWIAMWYLACPLLPPFFLQFTVFRVAFNWSFL